MRSATLDLSSARATVSAESDRLPTMPRRRQFTSTAWTCGSRRTSWRPWTGRKRWPRCSASTDARCPASSGPCSRRARMGRWLRRRRTAAASRVTRPTTSRLGSNPPAPAGEARCESVSVTGSRGRRAWLGRLLGRTRSNRAWSGR